MLSEIKTIRRNGNELFINENDSSIGILSDFWKWAHSDLVGNAERGILAEYIVALALNVNLGTRTEWDSYDILTENGIKVEVKSSGYIQTWPQKKYSNIIFGIQPTQFWDKDNNTYESIKRRQADIYVFCVHKHKEQLTINPLDLKQWDFYVISSKILNEKVATQKTITLSSVMKIGAILSDFSNLNKTVQKQNK